jgi:hypothetical protein
LIRKILQPNDHFLLFGGELGEFQLVNQQVDGIQDPVELIAVTADLAQHMLFNACVSSVPVDRNEMIKPLRIWAVIPIA